VIPTRSTTIPIRWPGYTGNINLGTTKLASQLTNRESEWPYTKKRLKWKERYYEKSRIRYSQKIWPIRHGWMSKIWMTRGMNISRPDSLSSQLQRNNIGTCMRSHYSTCIKPPPNPSKREKCESEIRERHQTAGQTTKGRRGNQPAHPEVIGKRSSKTTERY
jgi:hypothetical protein